MKIEKGTHSDSWRHGEAQSAAGSLWAPFSPEVFPQLSQHTLTHTVSVPNTTRRIVKRANIIAAEILQRYIAWKPREFQKKASVYASLRASRFLFTFFPQSSRGETERAGTFHANFTVQKRAGYRSDDERRHAGFPR